MPRIPSLTAWALNRYVYQEANPRKDVAFMSRTYDRELRREWIHRMHDHDGLLPEEHGASSAGSSSRIASGSTATT